MKGAFQTVLENADREVPNLVIDHGFLLDDSDLEDFRSRGYCVKDIRDTTTSVMKEIIQAQKVCRVTRMPTLIVISSKLPFSNSYLRRRFNFIPLDSGGFDFSKILQRALDCEGVDCWIDVNTSICRLKASTEETPMRKHLNALLEKYIDPKFQDFVVRNFHKVLSLGRSTVRDAVDLMDGVKKALIVLDGMALDDWYAVEDIFEFEISYLFALIPTLTHISRPSLVSGVLPRAYEGRSERNVFKDEIKNGAIHYDIQSFKNDIKELREGYIVFISPFPDKLMHSEVESKVPMYKRFRRYCEEELSPLVKTALDYSWSVYISSDHGNVECWKNYSKRIPEYVDRDGSRCLDIPGENTLNPEIRDLVMVVNGLIFPHLPEDSTYALPKERLAFTRDKFTVTHGGITPEEVVVPFVKVMEVKK